MQGYSQSKEGFVKNVCDDVIFLAPDEPIMKGKEGETSCTMVKATKGIRTICVHVKV